MTGDLEKTAVLAAEPDRNHRRLRTLDELRYERLPAPIDRGLEAELVGRGRNRASRKHYHGAAACELVARRRPRGKIGPLSFFGPREIDRQDKTGCFWRPRQHDVSKNDEIVSDLARQ